MGKWHKSVRTLEKRLVGKLIKMNGGGGKLKSELGELLREMQVNWKNELWITDQDYRRLIVKRIVSKVNRELLVAFDKRKMA